MSTIGKRIQIRRFTITEHWRSRAERLVIMETLHWRHHWRLVSLRPMVIGTSSHGIWWTLSTRHWLADKQELIDCSSDHSSYYEVNIMKFIKNREVDSDSQRGSAEHRSSMTESPDVVLAYRDVGRGQLADQELQEASSPSALKQSKQRDLLER